MHILLKRIYVKIFKVIHLHAKKPIKGNVLISYITYAFLRPKNAPENHTNYWECREMARIFQELGYTVDVIDLKNTTFIPQKKYTFFLDIHSNIERLSPFLNKDCIKIFHTTSSHWLFQNYAEYERLFNLQQRKKITLIPRRTLSPSYGLENADKILLLGNSATEKTYQYAGKKIDRIPLSATHLYPFPENKDINKAKKNFVWFSGAGLIHKGLDLVLEAFSEMPEYELFVCGKITAEKDFEKAYRKELYETKNIHTIGKVDPAGIDFKNIIDSSIALVYPSCSEGQSGAVITCMHAGLIPLISYQSGVNINDFGMIFKENTIEEIKKTVRNTASLNNDELKVRSKKAWEYARANHTREKFTETFRDFIKNLEKNKSEKK